MADTECNVNFVEKHVGIGKGEYILYEQDFNETGCFKHVSHFLSVLIFIVHVEWKKAEIEFASSIKVKECSLFLKHRTKFAAWQFTSPKDLDI